MAKKRFGQGVYKGYTGSGYITHKADLGNKMLQSVQKNIDEFNADEEYQLALQQHQEEQAAQAAKEDAVVEELNQQAEAEHLAPKNAIEQEASQVLPVEQYKGLKDITARIQELEDLNKVGKTERAYKEATKDTELLKNPLDYIVEGVVGKTLGLAELLSPNAPFMSDKQNKELQELKAKKSNIIKPIVEARLKRNDELIKNIEQQSLTNTGLPSATRGRGLGTFIGMFGVDKTSRDLQTANNLAWTERDELESALDEKNNIFNGFFGHTGNKIKSLLSVGIIPTIDTFKVASVMEKQRAGEPLTDSEKLILQAGSYKQDTQRSIGEKGFYSQLGEGLETSLELGMGLGVSGSLTKGAKALALDAMNVGARNSLKNIGAKALVETVNIGAQVAMSPFTYNQYAQKFISPIVVTKDAEGKEVILTSKAQKKAFESQAKNSKAYLTEQINRLTKEGQGESKMVEELKSQISEIDYNLSQIYDPETHQISEDITKSNAAIYAVTEAAKEVSSEILVGPLAGRAGHSFKKAIAGTSMETFTNGVGKVLSKVTPSISTTKVGKITSALGYHTNFNEVFQSVPEEFMEELVTGVVPTYNAEKGEYNMKDYYQQLEQFKDPNFYAQIAASTILMGGVPAGLAAVQHRAQYKSNADYKKAYDAQKKSMEDLGNFYEKLDQHTTDKDLADSITMRTGNTLYSVPQYEGKIAELRNGNKELEAKILEGMAFQNLAAQAVRTESLDEFELALKRMTRNGNLHPDTVANAQEALRATIPAMRDVEFKYKERPNYNEILRLATNEQIHDLDRKHYRESIAETQKIINDKIAKLKEQGHIDANFDIDSFLRDEEEVSQSPRLATIPAVVSSIVGEDIDRLIELKAGLEINQQQALKNMVDLVYQTDKKNLPAIKAQQKKAIADAIQASIQTIDSTEKVDELTKELVEANPNETVEHITENGKPVVKITNTETGEVRTVDGTTTTTELAEKKNQLEVQGAIQEEVPEFVPNNSSMPEVTTPEVVEGSKPLTEEVSAMVSLGGFNFFQGGGPVEGFEEQAFSPREINRSISEEQKNHIADVTNNYAKLLVEELGKEPTFDDMVKDMIERTSMKNTDENFEVYKLGWELSGRDISNAQAVYDKYLNARAAFIGLAGMFTDVKDLNTSTEVITTTAIEETSKTAKFDINNQPVVKDGANTNKSKTSISTPKAAFLGMEYVEVQTENGPVNTPVLAQLNKSTTIDNHLVLDPAFTKVGLKLEVRIPDDVDSQPVAYWYVNDQNEMVKEVISFGEWQTRKNVEKGSVAYNNKVPMIAHVDGKDIFLLHDTDWYNTKNVSGTDSQNQLDNIKSGKLQTQAVRGQVLSGNNQIEIEERKFGQIFRINTLKENNQAVVLSEATGDTKLTVASKIDTLKVGTNDVNLKLVNQQDFNPGQLYEVREVNTGEHIALPVLTNNVANGEMINDTAYYNVKFAILAGMALNHTDRQDVQEQLGARGMDLVKAREIQKAILESTGIDIQHAIQNYINMFTRVDFKNEQFISNLESSETKKGTSSLKYPTGINYITVENSGIIKIANKDGNPVPRNPKNPKYDALKGFSYKAITPNALGMAFKVFDENFGGSNGNFRKSSFNASVSHLGNGNTFHSISETGSILDFKNSKGTGNTYDDYIKDNVKSNIKSFPIKDSEGNTKWITDIQPMVYYKTTGAPISTERPSNVEEVQPAIIAEKEQAKELNQEIKEVPTVVATVPVVEQVSIQEAIDALPEDLKARMSEFRIEDFSDNLNFSRRELGQAEIEQIEGIKSNQISVLTVLQQKQLVNSMFNEVLASVSQKKGTINLGEVVDAVKTAPQELLQPEINRINSFITQIENLNDPTTQPLIENLSKQAKRLEEVINQSDKLTSTESENKGDLVKKIQAFLGEDLTEDSLEDINDSGEIDNSFSDTALERDIKLSFSSGLKVFFSGITKKDPLTNKTSRNFSYLPDYESVDTVIQSLTEVMVGLPSDAQDLISVLESKQYQPIYGAILRKVQTAPIDIQNELLYKMIQSKLDMYMVSVSQNKEGGFGLKVINPNSSASEVKMKLEWNANFSNSPLMKVSQDTRVYDKEAVEKVIADINGLSSITKLSAEHLSVVKPILEKLGIRMSDNTIERLLDSQGNGIYKNKDGVLNLFSRELQSSLNRNKESEIPLEDNNPYEDARGIIEKLIQSEIELNGTKVAKSFRTAGKSIQGAIQKMMVYEVKEGLKNVTSKLFQDLKQIPYSKNNFVLRLLEINEKFRGNFDIGFVSLQAIKKMKQADSSDRKVNKLTTTDHMLTQLAFFQNTQRELGQVLPESNLQFRMGQMFNPSLSDKEQMILYTTALVDTDYSNYTISGDNVSLSNDIVNFVTNQIFSSEFDRIIDTFNNPTNIKNYDGAAKRFLSIPKLNEILYKGKDIYTVMSESAHDPIAVSIIKEAIKQQANDIVRETLDANVKTKVNTGAKTGTWYDAGFITTDNNKNTVIKYFDSKYLSRKRGANTSISNNAVAQIAAYDFVVNQFLTQHMTYQLIAGDMALYAPSIGKVTNKTTKKVDFLKLVKATGESITKRMAMLIAPGSKLANSKGDKYLQIFINDSVKMTSTARELIKQYYGNVSQANEELISKVEAIENNLEQLYKANSNSEATQKVIADNIDAREVLVKQLATANPEIGGYFSIEGTDAQEYTTWKEHIDVLFRQGRLTDKDKKTLQSAYAKLEKGEDLDPSELAVVMNPIKPVYSGNNTFNNKDGKASVNRIVYVKSSSFPLLPQLTRDFKLDKIRQHMEALQKSEGKNVRMSYQTANKVGAINTKLTVDDLYNQSFEDAMKGNLGASFLELDRDNFRVQQDTPYKTAKNLKANKDDSTTMGSQMWKIILGNGINKITAKVFPNVFDSNLIGAINNLLEKDQILPVNGMVSGTDLDKIKFHSEKMYFDIQKKLLMDELGIDPVSGQPVNLSDTIKKVHELLIRETASGQYPEAVVDNLGLVKNQAEAEFLLPLWLSTNANKFESLLQSIITNRLIKIKLPGNQHISASSEGFARVTNVEELDDKIKSGVVWIDSNHTGDLKATTVDGKLKEAEILIQSKFRITKDGKTKLIDLTKAPYSQMIDGKLVLNKEMIEEQLLTNFSFRIPTSSHQSGAILKVVGFLPEASGDMLVVPKEQTVQLGEDYDVDKRTLYKSNYVVGKDGKITKLGFDPKSTDLKTKAKMLENAMIDIYKAVYLSPSTEVQSKVNKILSFDVASNTANLISDKVNSSKDESNFSTYTDEYQREQMKLGADGKTGIGAHSNAVTSQAQMERLHNPLQLVRTVVKEINGRNRKVKENSTMIIGGLVSEGTLGMVSTIKEPGYTGTVRSIGDVHTENQNSSTDNIKAQIMGKRNENTYTMNVLVQLTFRGFDQAKFTLGDKLTEVQIPSLFIAQPILRRYVELQEQSKSLTSDFDMNKDKTIMRKLIEEFNIDKHNIKYDNDGNVDPTDFLDEDFYIKASRKMTGDALYTNLVKEGMSSDIQLAVLQKFFELDREIKLLSKYTGMLNLSTSGLGISYFNVLDKIQTLNEMGEETNITNVRDLVGQFIPVEIFEENPPKDSEDYTLIGDFYIKPTTTEGTMLVQAISSAQAIMDPLFPYKESIISASIDKVLALKGENLGKKKKLELKYQVKDALKDYMYATQVLGLFEGDINKERQRLFFDTHGNTSLARYLKDALESKKHPLLENNELIKNLGFDGISIIGAPSTIKHISSTNTSFDRTDEYNAFLELLQDDVTNLGEFNGEVMTPRKLAQDLATYAYLANNESGAVGFRDFINVKYLEAIGVSERMRNMSKDLGGMYNQISNFTVQFFQHNPQEARQISRKSKLTTFKKTNPEADLSKPDTFFQNLEEFTLENVTDPFVAIEDTTIQKSTKGYKLYARVGNKYVRIPVLGSFGYNEYNPSNINQKSLMYPEVGKDVYQEQPISKQILGVNVEEALDTSDGVVSVLEQFSESPNAKYKEFAEKLAPFIDPTTKIVIEDKVIKGETLNTGVYDKATNTIYISPAIVNNLTRDFPENTMDILEEVVLEELVHSITISQLDKFGTKKGDKYIPNEDAPAFITRLSKLFSVAQEKLPYNPQTGENYYTKDIYEFVAGAFVSNEFKEALDNTVHNGKSLFEHFKDSIASLLRTITGSTYSDEVINSVYELLNYTKAEQGIVETNNPIETLKKGDDKLEIELSKLEPKVSDTNLKSATTYNGITSKRVLDEFNSGQALIVTPTKSRVAGSAEYLYMKDILSYLSEKAIKEGKTPADLVTITNIDANTQAIQLKEPTVKTTVNGKIEKTNRIITRSEVQSNPNTLYLFGDNDIRKGLGGQAKEMRGEPNVVGISTKKLPSNNPNAFKTDIELEANKKIITEDINRAIETFNSGKYNKVVIPPIGIGLAKLEEKAPKTWEFLQQEFARLENSINTKKEVTNTSLVQPLNDRVSIKYPATIKDIDTTKIIDFTNLSSNGIKNIESGLKTEELYGEDVNWLLSNVNYPISKEEALFLKNNPNFTEKFTDSYLEDEIGTETIQQYAKRLLKESNPTYIDKNQISLFDEEKVTPVSTGSITSIGGFNFQTGGPDSYSSREFRLPEIKKCK